MTPQSAIPVYPFATSTALALEATFDGGRLTSDGGLPWLAKAEEAVGICAALAACVPEWRRAHIHHSIEALVRQRVFGIACGYEDQNDADTLRSDPLLKLVCGRRPESDPDLASQPTMSRLENAVDRHACTRLAHALLDIYLRARAQEGVPAHIVLDIDSTDDPTHGAQEGTAYHGYYGQHMYHPLLIFDGETDQLITALPRPGNAHPSRGVRSVLRVLVPLLRARWSGVSIEIRSDSGCAVPALYDYCEREGIVYTIGLIPNSRLEAVAAPLLAQAKEQQATTGAKVRLVDETTYQAGTWAQARRVVYKAEALDKGPNTRFVATTRPDPPAALYDWYVDRGEPEVVHQVLKSYSGPRNLDTASGLKTSKRRRSIWDRSIRPRSTPRWSARPCGKSRRWPGWPACLGSTRPRSARGRRRRCRNCRGSSSGGSARRPQGPPTSSRVRNSTRRWGG